MARFQPSYGGGYGSFFGEDAPAAAAAAAAAPEGGGNYDWLVQAGKDAISGAAKNVGKGKKGKGKKKPSGPSSADKYLEASQRQMAAMQQQTQQLQSRLLEAQSKTPGWVWPVVGILGLGLVGGIVYAVRK
jgi:hypothetical protein